MTITQNPVDAFTAESTVIDPNTRSVDELSSRKCKILRRVRVARRENQFQVRSFEIRIAAGVCDAIAVEPYRSFGKRLRELSDEFLGSIEAYPAGSGNVAIKVIGHDVVRGVDLQKIAPPLGATDSGIAQSAVNPELIGREPSAIDDLWLLPEGTEPQPDLVRDLTRPSVSRALLERLHTLQDKPESQRWPTGRWPTDVAFSDARKFVDELPSDMLLLPSVGAAHDGEINFLWKGDGVHIDLGFYGDGTFSFYAHREGDEEFYDDDIPVDQGLPDALKDLIRE